MEQTRLAQGRISEAEAWLDHAIARTIPFNGVLQEAHRVSISGQIIKADFTVAIQRDG